MTKFDVRNYMTKMILEAEQQMPQQQEPQDQQAQKQAPQGGSTGDAFRSLQGQTIAGVQYMPNGSTGGTVKIKVKNSYVPFTISWANQQVTVTDLQGNTVVLGENQQ